jgi:G:T-mismatch repair DNA endonuclease (very short patch repair protein)
MIQKYNITKEELEEMYKNKHCSITKINKITGISPTHISRLLKRHGIPRRKFGEGKLPYGFVKPTRDELYELYCMRKLSVKKIADRLCRSKATIISWIKANCIPYRGSEDFGAYNKGRSPPNKGKGKLKERKITKRTKPEILMRNLLEENNLLDGLEEQYPLKIDGIRTKIDFAYPKKKLYFYVDGLFPHGGLHHLGRKLEDIKQSRREGIKKTMKTDAKITLALNKNGWRGRRFYENEVKDNPNFVVNTIKGYLIK